MTSYYKLNSKEQKWSEAKKIPVSLDITEL
jgi:hypothetical protein